MKVKLNITKKFEPFLKPRRYKVAYGGRGSGKSWTIAHMLVKKSWEKPVRILCAREIQRSIQDSVLQLLSDTIERMGLRSYYDVQRTQIIGSNGSRFIFEGLRSNITKIKSMEGLDIVWLEEAESITYSSWETLIPTIRKDGSEIWCSFNPNDEMDNTYERFVTNPPNDAYVVKVNYNDNPWFPKELEAERLQLKEKNLDLYNHVWEGEVLSNRDGSYYAKFIDDSQVLDFPLEPTIPVDTYWDLGMADATSIWFVQRIGNEVRIVHAYESQGEGLQYYINYIHDWRSKNQITMGQHYAPHDISVRELGTGVSRLESARKMGINFRVAPKLSIEDGIHAARQLLPKCYFHKTECKDGLNALRRYRKEFDEKRGVYKSQPLHDWSSHFADSFRYMAVSYRAERPANQPQPRANISWMQS